MNCIKSFVGLVMTMILFTSLSFGQDPTPPSDLFGIELKNWLKQNWYDSWEEILDYSEAREEMYSYIDNEGGKVYCVYSGFSQNSEFTSFLDPINCEHSVPQSYFGSSDPMKSDIHHLYPTHGNVNSARGNLPFIEVNDNTTDTWYVGDESDLYDNSSIPTVSIESYSELWTNEGFEPREDHKGDLARSIFYFYTMYPTQAGPIEDLANVDMLYDWHINDPVDDSELTRDTKIQEVQGNFNPYVRDADLVGRAWGYIFPNTEEYTQKDLRIYPNPALEYVQFDLKNQSLKSVVVYDFKGIQVISEQTTKNILNCSHLAQGIYYISILEGSLLYSAKFLKR